MTAPKRKPAWPGSARPQSDKPRAEQCPKCQAPTLFALVGHIAAIYVRADPFPLSPRQELAARLQGRHTYCLRLHPHLPPRLLYRGVDHIRAGRCRHLVVADHHCTSTAPPVSTTYQSATDRLF